MRTIEKKEPWGNSSEGINCLNLIKEKKFFPVDIDLRILWAADGAAQRSSENFKKFYGLAAWCIEYDHGQALSVLLHHTDFIASKVSNQEEWDDFNKGLITFCVEKKAESCIIPLCDLSQKNAWLCAMLSIQEVKKKNLKRLSPWAQGYKMSVKKALNFPEGSLKGDEKEIAINAIKEGLRCEENRLEVSSQKNIIQVAAMSACEFFLNNKSADIDIAFVLFASSLKTMNPKEESFDLAFKIASACSSNLNSIPSVFFGFKPGRHGIFEKKISGYDLNVPEKMDTSWILASCCENEKMKNILDKSLTHLSPNRSDCPSVSVSVTGLTHPLSKIWDAWSHSKRAGHVLPVKVIKNASDYLKKMLHLWENCIEAEFTEVWKEEGSRMLASLFRGEIPESFSRYNEKPTTENDVKFFSRELTPLAWFWIEKKRVKRAISESAFVEVALAQDQLGYSLDFSINQIKTLTDAAGVDSKLAAAAQRAILSTSTKNLAKTDHARIRL